jgi:CARDB
MIRERVSIWPRAAILAAGLLIVGSGCARYYFFPTGEVSCIEKIPRNDPLAPAEYIRWLTYWQSTDYCQRVRAQWFGTRPDLIVSALGSCPDRAGNAFPPAIKVRNVGNTAATPFDVTVTISATDRSGQQAFSLTLRQRVTASLAPNDETPALFSGMQMFQVSSGDTITISAMADPPRPRQPFGEVLELDEMNNSGERVCPVIP